MAQFPHSFGKFAFPQSFHTRKLCEITLFYIVFGSIIFDLYHNLINHISSSSNRFSRISLFEQYASYLIVWHRPFIYSWIFFWLGFTAWNVSVFGVFLSRISPHLDKKNSKYGHLFSYWRVSLDGSDFTATNRPKKLFLLQNFP